MLAKTDWVIFSCFSGHWVRNPGKNWITARGYRDLAHHSFQVIGIAGGTFNFNQIALFYG